MRALSAPFDPGPELCSGLWPPWGGGAPTALGHLGTLWGARVPFDGHARLFRRSTCGVSRPGTALPGAGGRAQPRPYPGSISAAFQPVHVQPLKGSPHLAMGAGGVRDDPEPCAASAQKTGRHTLLRQRFAPGGALSW